MATATADSPLHQIPPPLTIRQRMGELQREMILLKQLLRLSLATRSDDCSQITTRVEAGSAR
jgi:hypothetical protein